MENSSFDINMRHCCGCINMRKGVIAIGIIGSVSLGHTSCSMPIKTNLCHSMSFSIHKMYLESFFLFIRGIEIRLVRGREQLAVLCINLDVPSTTENNSNNKNGE